MTPKEKTLQLVNSFKDKSYARTEFYQERNAKNCALICVDVILNDVGAKDWEDDEITNSNYWQEVKQEIKKL
jgi:hypothetical protein